MRSLRIGYNASPQHGSFAAMRESWLAAEALGVAGRIGMLKPGMEADLLLVDGNPLRDITVTERISAVIFRGERVVRSELFEQEE